MTAAGLGGKSPSQQNAGAGGATGLVRLLCRITCVMSLINQMVCVCVVCVCCVCVFVSFQWDWLFTSGSGEAISRASVDLRTGGEFVGGSLLRVGASHQQPQFREGMD